MQEKKTFIEINGAEPGAMSHLRRVEVYGDTIEIYTYKLTRCLFLARDGRFLVFQYHQLPPIFNREMTGFSTVMHSGNTKRRLTETNNDG